MGMLHKVRITIWKVRSYVRDSYVPDVEKQGIFLTKLSATFPDECSDFRGVGTQHIT